MGGQRFGTGPEWGRVGRAAAALALVMSACLPAARAEQTRVSIPIVLFDMALDAVPPDGGPNVMAITQAANESLRAALRTTAYDPTAYNPESAPVLRAIRRTKTLGLEDLAHPEQPDAARRIAAAYGARYVLFPRIHNMILSLDDGQSRVDVAIRAVPDIGPERAFQGEGTAKLKPERRSRTYAMRLLQPAIDAACREAVKQLAGTGGSEDPASQASAARSYFTDGMQRLRQGRLDQAQPLLERATRLDPRNAEYATALADVYQRAGQTASALMEYRRAATIQPGSVDVRVRLAKVYLLRNMVKEASAELRRASEIDPDHQEVRSALAEIYVRSNMVDEAIAEYRRIAEANPEDASARIAIGDLQLRRGRVDDALEEYKRAASIRPQDAGPHEKLAAIYRQKGMAREALREMILAHRTPGGADDAGRYRSIADALDHEAAALLNEALKILADRRAEKIRREDAFTAVKALAARAEALAAEAADLKAAATLTESHRRRVLAYSLLDQSLVAYQGFYEGTGDEESANADLLQVQAVNELKRAREAMGMKQ